MDILVCPSCHQPTQPAWIYCPVCGKKILDTGMDVSVGKQIGVYIMSILFPPFGLWPAFRYLRQEDPKAKKIGWTAIILTIFSLLVTIWMTRLLFQTVQQTMNSQMQEYNGLSF